MRRNLRNELLAFGVILAGALFLSLTITRPPSPALADEIDRLLVQDPCVGSTDLWPSRYYTWGMPEWANKPYRNALWVLTGPWFGSDTSKVHIRFHERAHPEMYRPGRHLLRADQQDWWLDSSNDMSVWGTYEIETRRLTEFYCGPNGE